MDTTNPHFLGMARIHLKHLELDPMKHIDTRRVKRLVRDFKRFGCKNDEIAHAVPVLVDGESLKAALAHADLTPLALFNVEKNSPILHFPDAEKLRILYGEHRIRAAKEKRLPVGDRWWSVSLYDSRISAKARAKVVQGNRQKSIAPNSRELASFLGEEDQEVVDVWTSNMSKTHQSTCRGLREEDDGRLSRALQEVLRFRGLQYGAGNWGPILAMRCREETYAYLHAIVQTWQHILEPEVRPDQLDESTVRELQTYFPAYSSHDCDAIIKLFATNKVFPSVHDARDRENITRRVLTCKRIVTLNSFFNDFIYLRTCFDGLKVLLPPTWKDEGRSFENAFDDNWRHHHQSDGGQQVVGSYFKQRPVTFRECYVDLWLFAMREFPYLSDGKASQPLQDGTSADSQAASQSPVGSKQAQLAFWASDIGFETDEIDRIKAGHPTDQQNRSQEDGPMPEKPDVSSYDATLSWRDRSGRPSRTNYTEVSEFVHRGYVFDTSTFERRNHATAYAIARDIVQCCWQPDLERWVGNPVVKRELLKSDKTKPSRATDTQAPQVERSSTTGDRKSITRQERQYLLYSEIMTSNPFMDDKGTEDGTTTSPWSHQDERARSPPSNLFIRDEALLPNAIQQSADRAHIPWSDQLDSLSGPSSRYSSDSLDEAFTNHEWPCPYPVPPGVYDPSSQYSAIGPQDPLNPEAINTTTEIGTEVEGSTKMSGVKSDQQCAGRQALSAKCTASGGRTSSVCRSERGGTSLETKETGLTLWPVLQDDVDVPAPMKEIRAPKMADVHYEAKSTERARPQTIFPSGAVGEVRVDGKEAREIIASGKRKFEAHAGSGRPKVPQKKPKQVGGHKAQKRWRLGEVGTAS